MISSQTCWPLDQRGRDNILNREDGRDYPKCVSTAMELLRECDNVTGSHFWTNIWRASATLTCPSGPISTVCHRNRTCWEITVRGAQWILKGQSALGSNDHPNKQNHPKNTIANSIESKLELPLFSGFTVIPFN